MPAVAPAQRECQTSVALEQKMILVHTQLWVVCCPHRFRIAQRCVNESVQRAISINLMSPRARRSDAVNFDEEMTFEFYGYPSRY